MSPSYRRSLEVVFGLTVLTSALGCSGSSGDRPKTVPVTGTVIYNGEPIEGAHVTFFSPDKSVTAFARTGSDGTFKLTTFDEGDGAVVGTHKVSIMKREIIGDVPASTYTGEGDPPANYEELEDQPALETRSILPAQYSNVETSNLTAEVTERGDNDFPFTLTD
jgi:hypothetical protein